MFRGRSVLLRVAKAAAVAGSRRALLSVTSKSIPALTNTIAVRKSFVTSTSRALSTFKTAYDKATAARAAQGIVPKALDAASTSELVALLKNPPAGEEAFLLDLITNRVPPGVDEAAYVKAAFLTAITRGEATSPIISPEKATELLATMQYMLSRN